MANFDNVKRISVDTNILIILALKSEQKSYCDVIRRTDPLFFDNLNFLEKQVKNGVFELIITPKVLEELVFRVHQEKLDKYTGADMSLDAKKDLALKYIEKTTGAKIVQIDSKNQKNFKNLSTKIAKEYCAGGKKAVFQTKNNGAIPNDAVIMAQSAVLGLDLLTCDNHFLKTDEVVKINNPKAIKSINKKFLKTTATALSFENLRAGTEKSSKKMKKLFPIHNKQFSYALIDFIPKIKNKKQLNLGKLKAPTALTQTSQKLTQTQIEINPALAQTSNPSKQTALVLEQ